MSHFERTLPDSIAGEFKFIPSELMLQCVSLNEYKWTDRELFRIEIINGMAWLVFDGGIKIPCAITYSELSNYYRITYNGQYFDFTIRASLGGLIREVTINTAQI